VVPRSHVARATAAEAAARARSASAFERAGLGARRQLPDLMIMSKRPPSICLPLGVPAT
jgi:hypothetical protein